MILTAEKSNLQAELAFYKAELAKLCLRTGTKFPVFHQQHLNYQQKPHHENDEVDSVTTAKILVKSSSKPR